jgi:carboxyl-terminal processing protease
VAAPGTGYLRIAEFSRTTVAEVRAEAATLARAGATRLVIDLRGTAGGDLDAGFDVARLFVPSGVLGYRQARGEERQPVNAANGDGALTLPIALLADNGTSGPAEVFAAALAGNKRASVVGERSLGRTARQKVINLPDGAGLLLTHLLYLGPGGASLHERGVAPDVVVDLPTVDFGVEPTPGDPILDKALETLAAKQAA